MAEGVVPWANSKDKEGRVGESESGTSRTRDRGAVKDDEGRALGNNAAPAVDDPDLAAVASAMADRLRKCLDIWVVDRNVVTTR